MLFLCYVKRFNAMVMLFKILFSRDDSGFFGIDMGITGVPETFIVDEKGTIVLRHVGPIDFSDKILKP